MRLPAAVARAAILAVLPAGALLAPPSARAETAPCNIIQALPADIFVAGRYCLDKDFVQTYTGAYAVRIYADKVVFDCKHHRLVDTNPANTNVAFLVTGDHDASTIRNCVIDGFQGGILIQESADNGSRDHVIEDNLILRSRQVGISVSGSNNRIENNRVLGNTGNLNGVSYGIRVYSSNAKGVGNTIRGNRVGDFRSEPPPGTGSSMAGINFFNVHQTEVSDNTVSGLYNSTGQGIFGINGSQGTGSIVTGNTVLSAPPRPAPLDGPNWYGIYLQGTADEQATNVCRDNTAGHFATNVTGCVSVGNVTF